MNLIKRLFGKKQKKEYPHRYAKVTVTDLAKFEGINDAHNSEIRLYKEEVRVKEYPFSIEMVNSLRQEGIPILGEMSEKEFKFTGIANFGNIQNVKDD